MWIFDLYCKGYVELWDRERGLTKVSAIWEELKGIRNENMKQKELLEESQITIQHLQDDLLRR